MRTRQVVGWIVGVSLFIAALLFVLRILGPKGASPGPGDKTWKVGVIAPLTGPAAQFGTWVRNGLLVAQAEIRDEGKLPVPELVIEDSQGQPAQAVSIFTRFATVDGVDAVLVVTSGETIAIAPLATEHRLLTITGTIMPEITKHSPYLFRNSTSLELEIEKMAEHLASESPRPRVAILSIAIDAGDWARRAFRERYEAAGGSVVADATYTPGTTGFRPQLTSLKAAEPEVLYFLGYSEYGLAMRQARELGIQARFAGITTIEDPKGLAMAGDAAEGTTYTRAAFDPEERDPTIQAFVERYTRRTGEPPEVFAATFRDDLFILARAFAIQPKTGDSLRDTLLRSQPFPGASGATSFREDRDVVKPVVLRKVKGGQFVPYTGQ